ncbi:MAG TPA: LysR substrate-binding domain-containing protein [Microbacterium sp.]|nr:LysR substrate-binding domain-containing protein [Microbacterium sp.]
MSVFSGFRDAVAGIDRTLDAVHGFDPANSHRVFRIALSELGEIGWLPAILKAVRSEAPRMSIEVVPLDVEALPDWLARGVVDLAVTPSPVPGRFEQVLLKSQDYGVAMSAANPLADRPLTMEAYLAAHHVTVAGDSGLPNLAAALARLGVILEPHVRVNHFTSLPLVLAGDDSLVATVPDTIAAGWALTWPLALKTLPFEMPAVNVRLFRRATTQQTAALDWLFTTVARAIEGSSGQFFVIHGDSLPKTAGGTAWTGSPPHGPADK